MGHARRSRTREGAAAPTALLVRSRGSKTRNKTQRAGSGFSRNREEETTEATRAEHELALGLATKITNLLVRVMSSLYYQIRVHRGRREARVFESPMRSLSSAPIVSPSTSPHSAHPLRGVSPSPRRRHALTTITARVPDRARWMGARKSRPQPPGCARTERDPRSDCRSRVTATRRGADPA